MNLKVGAYNTLPVLRETDFSFMLGDEDTEVFLHKKQMVGELEPGEDVTVFLYYDNQRRITATMKKPYVDQAHPAFLDVVDVNQRLGIFLDMGLIKDLLLSRDDLPFIKREWPQKGDKLFVRLRASKNQLTAKLMTRFDINNFLKPEKDLEFGQEVEAYNVYKAEEGNVFFTLEGHYIFVYFKHMRKPYRLGEKATIKIMMLKGNFQYGGTLIAQKEIMIDKDAARIKDYLERNDGVMAFTDKSSSEEINEVFMMSKGAFKRALGTLYKNGIVLLEKDKTSLVKEEVVDEVLVD